MEFLRVLKSELKVDIKCEVIQTLSGGSFSSLLSTISRMQCVIVCECQHVVNLTIPIENFSLSIFVLSLVLFNALHSKCFIPAFLVIRVLSQCHFFFNALINLLRNNGGCHAKISKTFTVTVIVSGLLF